MTTTASAAALRDRIRPVLGVVAVVAAIGVLHRLGTGSLAAPPLGPASERTAWLASRDPVTVGFALFRLGALVLAYHLAATTAVAATGRLLHRPGVVRAATAWTLPPFRGAVRRAVGLGLSAAAALSAPVPSALAAPTAVVAPGRATMRGVDPAVSILQPDGGPGSVTLRLAPPPSPAGRATLSAATTQPSPPPTTPTTTTPTTTSTSAVPPATGPDRPASEPAPPPERPPAPGTHVVRPGDHLWRIAEDALAAVLGRPPTDDEVAPYWRRVVAANPQLVDPDLLFPGDAVAVPAP